MRVLRHRTGRDRRRQQGQGLVEFALVLPVLMLILLGILQFGFLLSGQIGLINSVREAARYGSTSPTTDNAAAALHAPNICNQLKTNLAGQVAGYQAANLVLSGGPRTNVVYASYPDPNGTTYSVSLTVTVVYRHPLFLPLIGNIMDGFDGATDGFFRLDSKERMRVENPVLQANPGASLTYNCT